jgi:hypothetical protein
LLWEDQETISYLRSINEESKVHTIMFRWLNACRTGLEIFGESLTLDDVVVDDEATQAGARAGSSCAIDESRLSSGRR